MSQSTVVNLVQQNRTVHLEQNLRQLIGAGSVASLRSCLDYDLKANQDMGGHVMTLGSRSGAYVDAVEFASVRSHGHRHGLTRRLTRRKTGLRTRLWRYIYCRAKVCPEGAAWMASTGFCEAYLAVHW